MVSLLEKQLFETSEIEPNIHDKQSESPDDSERKKTKTKRNMATCMIFLWGHQGQQF